MNKTDLTPTSDQPERTEEQLGPETQRCRVHLTGGDKPTLRCYLTSGHEGPHQYDEGAPR